MFNLQFIFIEGEMMRLMFIAMVSAGMVMSSDALACHRCRRVNCCCRNGAAGMTPTPNPLPGPAAVPGQPGGTLLGAPTPAGGSGTASATALANGPLTTLLGDPVSADVGTTITGPGAGSTPPRALTLLNTNDPIATETWRQLSLAQAKIRKGQTTVFDLRKASLQAETGSVKETNEATVVSQLLDIDAVESDWK
jgi:hypothetical protein